MTASRLATAAALITLLSAAPAQAQFMELNPGTRIRLRAPSSVAGQLTGVVLARSGDSITMSRSNATPVTLPISALTSLDISRGKSHGLGARKGALWGSGTFLVLGLVIPAEKCVDGMRSDNCYEGSRTEGVLWTAAAGAITGAVIGAFVGAERWERAALPLRVSVRPMSSSGVQVAVRWR